MRRRVRDNATVSRTCTICVSHAVEAINGDLLSGRSIRDIAGQHKVSKSSLDRHRAEHIPAALARAKDARNEAQGDSLLQKMRTLDARAIGIATKAENRGDLRVAMSGIREQARLVELQAKLAGQLNDATTVNVVVGPEWTRIRAVLLSVLQPYPEARAAVVRALAEVADA